MAAHCVDHRRRQFSLAAILWMTAAAVLACALILWNGFLPLTSLLAALLPASLMIVACYIAHRRLAVARGLVAIAWLAAIGLVVETIYDTFRFVHCHGANPAQLRSEMLGAVAAIVGLPALLTIPAIWAVRRSGPNAFPAGWTWVRLAVLVAVLDLAALCVGLWFVADFWSGGVGWVP